MARLQVCGDCSSRPLTLFGACDRSLRKRVFEDCPLWGNAWDAGKAMVSLSFGWDETKQRVHRSKVVVQNIDDPNDPNAQEECPGFQIKTFHRFVGVIGTLIF